MSRASWQSTGAGATTDSYLPTVPNTPTNFAANTALDNFRYNGLRTFSSQSDMINAIQNVANWTGNDTTVASTADFGTDFTINAVPEPSSMALVGLVVMSTTWIRRRR